MSSPTLGPITGLSAVLPAARAYGASASGSAGAAQGSNFASLVGNAARSSLQAMRNSEVTAARGVAGTADVQAVVQAATAAELTVQAVTQLRDKAVSAYMDVLHMAV